MRTTSDSRISLDESQKQSADQIESCMNPLGFAPSSVSQVSDPVGANLGLSGEGGVKLIKISKFVALMRTGCPLIFRRTRFVFPACLMNR